MTTVRPADTLQARTAASLQLEADVRALVAKQRERAGLVAEQSHLLDPSDSAFVALACNCPATACGCDADYPGFAEWVAAREADNRRAREEVAS